MFQVKATLVEFLGDEQKYPCHFNHRLGDEFSYDGEEFHGRLCPHVITVLMPKLEAMYDAGPRYVQPPYYSPFWYAPLSARDASMKDYDGVGWRALPEDIPEPPYSLKALLPRGSFAYPTNTRRDVLKDVMVICPDVRTSAAFKLEAFDLAERGEAAPYFRKQMAILEVVRRNEGIRADEVRGKLSLAQRDEVYPLAAPVLVAALTEELEAIGYVRIDDGCMYITEAGETKLEDFKASVTEEARRALEPELQWNEVGGPTCGK
jgi:uncharacterized repeat protein (TIGR04076 family)